MNRVEIRVAERGTRTRRRALNSPLRQGVAETVRYFVNLTPWGASVSYPVSTPVITILDQDSEDVTHGGQVVTAVITDGGTSYEVNDILTITDSGSSGDATVKVLTVNAGVILTIELVDVGYDYTAGVKNTTGHTADATVTITVADAKIQVRATGSIVSSVEIQFDLANFVSGNRYRVYIKGTINSLVGECWLYIDGEL